ncbi:hypothetical protein PQU94_09055 [Asticcacaulis sp. DXS10W]|uniref:Uncharacterized protein n=1 Tax=Asticcacaulis currens TaxID=2984210 RepID=A0ABT5IE19_9CAUL|nr:hypothetical protein [Asticcacaulis currens]MDC7694428.1 hypothetical protein [Asticcacaulis currens]
MRLAALKSIGHNIADSLASGMGFMIGVYATDIFGEASATPEGYILVDFITGETSGGKVSPSLAKAVLLYSQMLGDLCNRHGVPSNAFRLLEVRYVHDPYGQRFVVSIEDQTGRKSIDEYIGNPGKRVKELDHLGRIRPKRHSV